MKLRITKSTTSEEIKEAMEETLEELRQAEYSNRAYPFSTQKDTSKIYQQYKLYNVKLEEALIREIQRSRNL
jgi:hypothetical protein